MDTAQCLHVCYTALLVPCASPLQMAERTNSLCAQHSGRSNASVHMYTRPPPAALHGRAQDVEAKSDAQLRALFTMDSLALWLSLFCDLYGAFMLAAVRPLAVFCQVAPRVAVRACCGRVLLGTRHVQLRLGLAAHPQGQAIAVCYGCAARRCVHVICRSSWTLRQGPCKGGYSQGRKLLRFGLGYLHVFALLGCACRADSVHFAAHLVL